MSLSGGATDKICNRYEARWTVHCMIDVMTEKADFIQIEKAGEDAFEFLIDQQGKLEGHQVKRQISGRGRWTLSALEDKQVHVLTDFWKYLQNPELSCVFVSTQDADELRELANRARDAASWTEFKQTFLTQTLSGKFKILRGKWDHCSEIDAYEALQRVSVKTVDENILTENVESRLASLVEGDPITVRLELTELALNKIHQKLTTYDIWYHLYQRGYRRREWGKDPHVLAAVDIVNKRYIERLSKEAIAGKIIPRDEVDIIINQLTSLKDKRGILVVGEAGIGKSSIILQTVEVLHQKGIPLIAFRVDSLDPTDSPNQVGEQLEKLPSSPAHVLANIAQDRECILIIDQLDAVSTASGRNPQFFECIDQIIDQAQAFPKMLLLLACRKFDLEYDSRIKRLVGDKGVAEKRIINRFSQQKVREIVADLKLDNKLLTAKQLELLSIPLHLKLLAEVAESSKIQALNFRTAKDLYDKFWDYKKDLVYRKISHSEHWTDVIDTLCDYMSRYQRLSVPKARLDRYAKTAELMVSEHILVLDGQQYSFFHEGFFDYAFARRFASEDQDLLSLLGSREEQHLFRRAQIRQILLYERDADRDRERYLMDLKDLLTSSQIRFHLKEVVFGLLATLDNPTEEEWEIIAAFMGDEADPMTKQVWRTLRSSLPWFRLLDELGIIEKWLKNEREARIDQTVNLLWSMAREIPDRVVELVEPFIGVSKVWNCRLNNLVDGSQLDNSERFFRLFLRLIREGMFDFTRSLTSPYRDFWRHIYSLPEKHPDRACEAIGCYLNYHLELSLAAGRTNPFDQDSGILSQAQFDEVVLTTSAQNAPKAFIQYILPFILRVIELTAIKENNLPWPDLVWEYRSYGRGYNFRDNLLLAMETSLSHLAARYPKDFLALANQHFRKSNFETIQYLLIRAYTANGTKFADEAIDYLCEQPARLKTGYSICNGNIHAAPYWASRQLIEAVTPHCSDEHIVKLEAILLNYYSKYTKTTKGLKIRGYSQFVLLNAITPSRRSEKTKRRLQEWQRKFTSLQFIESPGRIEPPQSIEAYMIGSPISDDAASKMTDEQWLQAISHYNHDEIGSNKSELTGGAWQLSGVLKRQVKQDPVRFSQLIRKFPDYTNLSYFNAVLQGLAEVNIDVEIAVQVCHHCHQLQNRPCGQSISNLLEKLAKLAWPQEALEILIWYALEDPNPQQELWRTETSNGQVYYGGDILNAGINSTRGRTASAIARLIFTDKKRAGYFQQPLQRMVQDPSIAVRSCVAEALTAVLNYDRDLAVSLFQQLCEIEEALLGTQTIEHFLSYALPTHFEELAPIVEQMLMSEIPEVIKVGSRQACLISLVIEEANWLAELCLSGTEIHRSAAAEIYVAYLRKAHLQEFCEKALIQLFHDENEEVRSSAARCFWKIKDNEIGNHFSLIEEFVASPAFFKNSEPLILLLEKATNQLPEKTTYEICERLLKDVHSGSANADSVNRVLVKLYNQSKDKQLQSSCLDLIDLMAQKQMIGLAEVLTQYER